MAFIVDKGQGYTIEARIAKKAIAGYDPNATIGFTYSVDKGGAKFQWDKKNCGNGFWEYPSMWPDLELSEVLSVDITNKLPIRWGNIKLGLRQKFQLESKYLGTSILSRNYKRPRVRFIR